MITAGPGMIPPGAMPGMYGMQPVNPMYNGGTG